MTLPMPSAPVMDVLRKGVVIPACPLALDGNRRLDERHQRALIRYYCAAGAGGVAVGVHTTQFEIRKAGVDLFKPVLELAAATLDEEGGKCSAPIIKIAGVCGKTRQAISEAELASTLGYDIALVSLGALRDAPERDLIQHCKRLSETIPLMGFYLQPAVGGRILPYSFWRQFVEIENVVAIKIAPFNRYQTLDVVRAVAHAGVEDRVALYTGNDDSIIVDLLTPYTIQTEGGPRTLRIRGGLLGQWSVWTSKAVELLNYIHSVIAAGKKDIFDLLEKNVALTDANSVVFDAAHNFAGCISGINEVLRRQGLMKYAHCLDPTATLASGQSEELDRIHRDYPWLTDDEFVRQHLEEWLQ
jgi:dihydrodipicolinate synthase/N-acetylneuraminate lyase